MDFPSSAIEQTERELEEAQLAAESARLQLADIEKLAQQRKDELNEIITWADVYHPCSPPSGRGRRLAFSQIP